VSLPEDPLAPWRRLRAPGGGELLAAVRALGSAPGPAAVKRLRDRFGAPLLAACLELVRAQKKLARKTDDPSRWLATVEGAEQASSTMAAAHKAKRFADLDPGPPRILDLCCGIGLDAASLVEVAPVIAYDRSRLHAYLAAANTSARVIAQDVTTLRLAGEVCHLDPARRASGKRRHGYEDLIQGPSFIEPWLQKNPDTAVKLGPGVDFSALPDPWSTEVEVIGEPHGLTQAVLWSGRLARKRGRRTATLLPHAVSYSGEPSAVVPGDPPGPGAFLLEVHAALERADLLGAFADDHGLCALHERLNLLVADAPIQSPFLTPFELVEAMPWRPKRVRAALRSLGAGEVTIKTRGGACDPDREARKLRGEGTVPITVFVLRQGRALHAYVTSRVQTR
jgi:hypothetical protein